MDKNEKKHMEDLERLQMAEHLGKWYGWGSPIGLSVFFLTLVLIVAILKWVFAPHLGF
ncbi:MAG: hypothetical protein ACREHC_02015 [Candidatus Levyibacteriota bacterium]